MISMGSLRYSASLGEGNVKFSRSWSEENNTIRLDILQDWLAALEDEYERIRQIEYGNAERTEIANTIANTDAIADEKRNKDG